MKQIDPLKLQKSNSKSIYSDKHKEDVPLHIFWLILIMLFVMAIMIIEVTLAMKGGDINV